MYAYFYSIGRSELTTHWSAREPFGEMISLSIITVSEHTCACVCVGVERAAAEQTAAKQGRAGAHTRDEDRKCVWGGCSCQH